MRISVIGAGNGGQAMGGHFAMLGHEVSLFNRSIEKLRALSRSMQIELREKIIGVGKLKDLTDDLSQAIKGADLIMITTTADAHSELAKNMAPHFVNGQIVVLNPGRTLGALEFSQIVKKHTSVKIYVAEAQSLIYACRAELPGIVRIIGIKDNVLLSAYPAKDTDWVIERLNSVFSCFVKAENVLQTSLENIGAIFHPAVVVLNAAAIERGTMFYFYNDMTPAVASFLQGLDTERLKIGKAFGFDLLSVTDWISYAYNGIEGDNLCDKMRNNPAYSKILAPTTLYSRLIFEDIPTGILPLIELGKLAHIETPLLNAVFYVSQELVGIDFRATGRTLENLGVQNLSMEQFKEMIS